MAYVGNPLEASILAEVIKFFEDRWMPEGVEDLLLNVVQHQKDGGAPYSSIAVFVFAVTTPTMRSAMPAACLSRGGVHSILYLIAHTKERIASD